MQRIRKSLFKISLVGLSLISPISRGHAQEHAGQDMLKRNELPIEVSEQVWRLIEEVQRIQPLKLELDPTRKNGRISENVDSQFGFNNKFEIGIFIYTTELSEDLLAHEVLHAWRMVVKGFPRFVGRGLGRINSLESVIQHQHIFEMLAGMNLDPLERARRDWEHGLLVTYENRGRIITRLSPRDLAVTGVTPAPLGQSREQGR